ncbi:MAG: anthranilate phosphoribosyltransferase [Trueperaceae bacterium]|nr:anthranilate phosphoribosyltransferase [Trueperaceae bacterium]
MSDVATGTLLARVFDGARLTTDEARGVMGRLMDGDLSQMQAAALLAALRTRGETVDEIIGFAQAMRERAVHVPVRVDGPLLDTCGTGGTGISTINVSTTATFVAAADGVRIAKHGNRGVTKRSGSADLLEALGVRLEVAPERLAEAIETLGIGFVFARSHHPAMRFVAPIRADLQARTIFNNLGPLTNPAGATHHLMGVYDEAWTAPIAEVLRGLGIRRALVVHGDGLDDLALSGPSRVSELHEDGRIETYTVRPEELGVPPAPREAILGGDAATNAAVTRAILAGRVVDARRDVVALGAGAALYLAGRAPDLPTGVARALEVLRDGAGLALLERYAAFTQAA